VRPSRTALVSAAALAIVLTVLVVVLATSESAGERRTSSPLLGLQAPPLAGGTVVEAGGSYDLAADRGRWVLVNFFATDCIPCRVEHPELVAFSEAHADEARVVSVVFSDDPENVRSFFEERGGDWPVVEDDDGAIATRWGVARVPESYLVAPDGTVVSKIVGGVELARLEDLLTRARQPA
jgi:cytochrome c biogenesis protein CcmG/thiol:disulfide interchange protein DsbE